MNPHALFNPGSTALDTPKSDAGRQAVNALKGYAYQLLATANAWLDLDSGSRLFLEIAEDFAIAAKDTLNAVQVKDTKQSGALTLNSPSVRQAISNFVDYVHQNPAVQVHLRFLTTSEIGQEKAVADRPMGISGLKYWQTVAGRGDPEPLRRLLESDKFPPSVQEFTRVRDDHEFRRQFVQRIHWDCGAPGYETLRHELEDRMIVLCRQEFQIAAAEAQRIVYHLLHFLLEKASDNTLQARMLTRADLYREIDQASQLSVPRAAVNALLNAATDLTARPVEEFGIGLPIVSTDSDWFTDGSTLPFPPGMILRQDLLSFITHALEHSGCAVVVGGSGLGKSILSRSVAAALGDPFFIVDCRDADASECRYRLHGATVRIGRLPDSTLILEDLNTLDETNVTVSLSRLLAASRRRFRNVLVSCHRKLSLQMLNSVGLDKDCVIQLPYFTEEETRTLVSNHDGDPQLWGRLSYLAGANGHPQLTHAFVIGMSARNWPLQEIKDIVTSGLSTSDISAARESARRNLVSVLPNSTRTLLYRLSIVTGRFSRSLAVAIGAIDPPISLVGESLDQLIGPWIEPLEANHLRVSPLASGVAGDMLSADEQTRIHRTVAKHILDQGTLDVQDLNTAIVHAMAGKSSSSLTSLSYFVLNADAETRELLANNVPVFRLFRTDAPILPSDPALSPCLRLAQFKLAAVKPEHSDIAQIVAALMREISQIPHEEPKRVFEEMAILSILMNIGIANHLDGWVALLLRLKSMAQASPSFQAVLTKIEREVDVSGLTYLGVLFSTGTAGITSVRRLETILGQLDELAPEERQELLTPMDRSLSDYSVLISTPWVNEQARGDLDPADALARYRTMATKSSNWGLRALTLQCWLAQAVMLDEYLDNAQGALDVLEEAIAANGEDATLTRAIAKVHSRRGQHAIALSMLRGIADQLGRNSPVVRTMALRDAAISAASCDDWSQAHEWFLDAQRAARKLQSHDMQPITVGLGADAAVAALNGGQPSTALARLADAVPELDSIDPETSIRAAYCHRVIRHAALWMQSQITASDVMIEGEHIAMHPGSCSNLEPLPAVRELPLGHIDVVWYVLAQAEAAAGIDVGINSKLYERLTDGSIPAMEILLRMQYLKADIQRHDPCGFAAHFETYVDSAGFLKKNRHLLIAEFDPLSPERGAIPPLSSGPSFDPDAVSVATEAILAFLVLATIEGDLDAAKDLKLTLHAQFSGGFPGASLLDAPNVPLAEAETHEQAVMAVVNASLGPKHMLPDAFCVAGVRVFEWTEQSRFRDLLGPGIAKWQRARWQKILDSERYRLTAPRQAIPAIQEVLETPSDDLVFLARLFLVTAPAVGVRLRQGFLDLLGSFADS